MCPPRFRSERDGEDKTVDERLVEGARRRPHRARRYREKLARADMAALETQGRFIESRYGDDGPEATGRTRRERSRSR